MNTATAASPGTARALVGYRDQPKASGLPTSGLFLVVGHPKSGKTTFAASFPDSYVLELEPRRADRILRGRIDDQIQDLDTFGEVLQKAIEAEDIKTIVIDTVDHLAKWMQDDIAKAAGVEFLGKAEKGVDNRALWGEFAQRVHGLTDYLKESGKLIILVAHCKLPEKDDQGRVIVPAGINISGKGGSYIAAQAEMIGFVGVKTLNGKAQHFLSFKAPTDLAIWRSGIDELHDQEILLDKANPYGSFAAMFGASNGSAKAAPTLKPAASKTPAKRK